MRYGLQPRRVLIVDAYCTQVTETPPVGHHGPKHCYISECDPNQPADWCTIDTKFVLDANGYCQASQENCNNCEGVWYKPERPPPCLQPADYYVKVTSGGSCEEAGYESIFDTVKCTSALQTGQFGNELFEVDILHANTKPPGCTAALGEFKSLFGNRAYVNLDKNSPRIYANAYPNVGLCTRDTPCFCARKRQLCPRPPLPYTVVKTGTCRSNGYEDFLDMTQCAEVLGTNFYRGAPFGYHDVTGVAEPPGCWPLAPGFLNRFTASSRAVGFEACIGRNQSETRSPAFGYCSEAIPCYCKLEPPRMPRYPR